MVSGAAGRLQTSLELVKAQEKAEINKKKNTKKNNENDNNIRNQYIHAVKKVEVNFIHNVASSLLVF
jgi:hypothetical protein